MKHISSEKRCSKRRKANAVAVALLLLVLLCGCGGTSEGAVESSEPQTTEQTEPMKEAETTLKVYIDQTEVAVEWADNEAVQALKELAAEEPLTVEMSQYGGFEQVGAIGQSLPANDKQMTTEAGDIVLYADDQLVVFYGSNSWAYTKLGRIADKSEDELAELLGNKDVTITIRTE